MKVEIAQSTNLKLQPDIFLYNSTEPNKRWILPLIGTEGYIEDQATGMVLGITKYDTLERASVVLEAKQMPLSEEQMWSRSKFDSFSLINPSSGKVLRSLVDGSVTIEGMYIFAFIEKFVLI